MQYQKGNKYSVINGQSQKQIGKEKEAKWKKKKRKKV